MALSRKSKIKRRTRKGTKGGMNNFMSLLGSNTNPKNPVDKEITDWNKGNRQCSKSNADLYYEKLKKSIESGNECLSKVGYKQI